MSLDKIQVRKKAKSDLGQLEKFECTLCIRSSHCINAKFLEYDIVAMQEKLYYLKCSS